MTWDARERSGQYRTRAVNAEARARKFKAKVPKSDTYKQLHDAALAEFHIFNGLHGRPFLATPADLLKALHAMRGTARDASLQPYDRAAFEKARIAELDLLIKRIELELE